MFVSIVAHSLTTVVIAVSKCLSYAAKKKKKINRINIHPFVWFKSILLSAPHAFRSLKQIHQKKKRKNSAAIERNKTSSLQERNTANTCFLRR